MGGGGGQTASLSTGSANGGAGAPVGGGEIAAMMGMGLQLQLLKAQKENIQADTNLKNTEAKKKAGADTDLTEMQAADLRAGIKNKSAENALLQIEKDLKLLEYQFQDKTFEDRMGLIYWQTLKLTEETKEACANANVAESTVEQKVQIVKNEAAKTALEIGLTKALTDQAIGATEVQKATIRKIEAEIKQGWVGLSIQEQNQQLQKWGDKRRKRTASNKKQRTD